MPETPPPLPNEPSSRTPEGTILDQTQPLTTGTRPNASPTATPTTISGDQGGPSTGPTGGAPAEYKFTTPEGSALDPKSLEGATAIFRELGLDQAQAQRLIDFQLNLSKDQSSKSAEVYNQMRTDWRSQVEAHPTLGGQNLDQTKAEIGKAISTLPPKLQTAFKDAMNLTGAGDHPAVVEAFSIFSKIINEGQHVAGGSPSPEGQLRPGEKARPSPASAMFPNLPSGTTH